MPEIRVLDKNTINQIAAGEVVERPSSVVKELVENAIDAGATLVTVEIKNGGIDLVRVTDNGCGIENAQIRTAFMRHATSKIRNAEDLSKIGTLGFRGEALSSIAAVSKVELITKRKEDLSGTSYEIQGGEEIHMEEIGAPDGTTFLVREIFYNTPARRKFLKTAMTEASYIADLLEKIALSHPEVSIRFMNNGTTKLITSGNGKVKDLIYTVFGRETANEVTEINYDDGRIKISGFLGKPILAKGNRGFENYFINGRYVKSNIISRAIEEAYAPFLMQHRYPFTVLYLTIPTEEFDVNVHPTKMELRFQKESELYSVIMRALKETLKALELIPDAVEAEKEKKEDSLKKAPEPFEVNRMEEKPKMPEIPVIPDIPVIPSEKKEEKKTKFSFDPLAFDEPVKDGSGKYKMDIPEVPKVLLKEEPIYQPSKEKADAKDAVQMDLFETKLISDEGLRKHQLIGQIFDTYWLIQMDERFFILDQHAAHEKVLYERKMKELRERKFSSQAVSPPVMISLSSKEELLLNRYMNEFSELGYEVNSFGGHEYALSAVPADLLGLDMRELFKEILADMEEEFSDKKPDMILEKLASVSCKAAVKGNHKMSFEEADELIKELMTLDNPYTCPHGRPTMISMTKRELEKKFKRIV